MVYTDMITISTSDIQHLASLSSLALTDDETDGLRQDLENIIGYIEQLGELDVSGCWADLSSYGTEQCLARR